MGTPATHTPTPNYKLWLTLVRCTVQHTTCVAFLSTAGTDRPYRRGRRYYSKQAPHCLVKLIVYHISYTYTNAFLVCRTMESTRRRRRPQRWRTRWEMRRERPLHHQHKPVGLTSQVTVVVVVVVVTAQYLIFYLSNVDKS